MSDRDCFEIGDEITSTTNRDVIYYAGPISGQGSYRALAMIESKQDKAENALLVLTTYGGDAHAGYILGRALRRHYKTVDIYITEICKSAGTLICLAADRLIMTAFAELGPLDVQIRRKDELFEIGSGLEITDAVDSLSIRVMNSLQQYLRSLKVDNELSTKVATDIASKLVVGTFAPIFGQIDPLRIAEVQRQVDIAKQYGERLSTSNVKEETIGRLVSDYPSHDFIIDREEAGDLFKQVQAPTELEMELDKSLPNAFPYPRVPIVDYVSKPTGEQAETSTTEGSSEPQEPQENKDDSSN